MSQSTSETPSSATPATRASLPTGTLVFLGVWACVFAAFVVLGLRS